jgi:urease accessory protein
MIARAAAMVEPGGRLAHVTSQPPLTLRRLYSADAQLCALGLVGSAAGPLAGDELTLRLDVAPGASASLVAAGASIAQGRGTGEARLCTSVTVGSGGRLTAEPSALIVCTGSTVAVHVQIELADSATLTWRETLVLGRSGEAPGSAQLHWNVMRGGAPLLRQTVDICDPALVGWPGGLGRHRVLITELNVGDFEAATVIHSRTDVTQRLADGATLRTTLR